MDTFGVWGYLSRVPEEKNEENQKNDTMIMPCSIFLDLEGLTHQIFNLECAVLSRSVVSDSLRPCGLQPGRLLCPCGFSRLESWSGLPCPPPGDLPSPGVEPRSPLPACRQIILHFFFQTTAKIQWIIEKARVSEKHIFLLY